MFQQHTWSNAMTRSTARLLACLCVLMLAACASSRAPDIAGRWKPVNRLATSTTSIPLYQDYVYQVAPMDGTLKVLLERWARDTGLALEYRVDHDYTLVATLASINTTDRAAALAELGQAYREQGLQLTSDGQHLRVRLAAAGVAP